MTLDFAGLDKRIVWSVVAPEEASRRVGEAPEGWLAQGEQAAFAALHVESRRREWCAGRLAVKRAVQRWLEETQGMAVPLAEVVVRQDEWGAPHVAVPIPHEAPPVSIAHSDGYGLAALAPPELGVRIGVDIERLRDLNPRLLERLLAPAEAGCPAVQPPGAEPLDGVTLWTLKEAALKALGVGLRLPMRCLSIERLAPGHVRIHRAPGSPEVDDYPSRPWTAAGHFARWRELTVAIVTLRFAIPIR